MAMLARPGDKTILAICAALGIDPSVARGFDLHVRVGKPIELTVYTWAALSDDQVEQAANLLTVIVPESNAQVVETGDDDATSTR
jgi:hypothetical protein